MGGGTVAVVVAITGLSPVGLLFDRYGPRRVVGWRWSFGAIALTLAAGIAIYLAKAKDAKPSAEG